MNILIVKTSSLGDIIHAFYALYYLRKKFPEASIDWVVEKPFAELVLAHPFVDNVFEIDTKRWRYGRGIGRFFQFRKQLRKKKYDVVFDLQGNFKSGLITFLARAKKKAGFGKKTAPEFINTLFTNWKINVKPGLNIRLDLLEIVQNFFNDHEMPKFSYVQLNISKEESEKIQKILEHPNLRERKKILVSFGSAWFNKRLPFDVLKDFLQLIAKDKNLSFLFIWGSDKEKLIAQKLGESFKNNSIIVEKLKAATLQNLISLVDALIANDSFLLHLAGETNTKTFSFFGPSMAEKYKPLGENHFALQGKCPYSMTFAKRCPKLRTCLTGECIKFLTAELLKKNWEDFKPDSV